MRGSARCSAGVSKQPIRAGVEVTLEIHAHLPNGSPGHVVRTVTENCCTLRFTSAGFEPT